MTDYLLLFIALYLFYTGDFKITTKRGMWVKDVHALKFKKR